MKKEPFLVSQYLRQVGGLLRKESDGADLRAGDECVVVVM